MNSFSPDVARAIAKLAEAKPIGRNPFRATIWISSELAVDLLLERFVKGYMLDFDMVLVDRRRFRRHVRKVTWL